MFLVVLRRSGPEWDDLRPPRPPTVELFGSDLHRTRRILLNSPEPDIVHRIHHSAAIVPPAIQRMLAGGHERLLVLDDQGRIAGLLARRSLLRALAQASTA